MNCIFWTRKRERQENKQTTNGMCMPHPRNVQLPLRPRTLLITDVTRLQLFTVGGDNFRENIEMLISYLLCAHRWDPAGLPIYRAGPLNDPNYFHDLLNGGGSSPISSCNMDTYKEVLYAAGLPALILTGITLLIPPAKGLPVCRVCLTPPNRKEAGSGHAKWSSTSPRLNCGRQRLPRSS